VTDENGRFILRRRDPEPGAGGHVTPAVEIHYPYDSDWAALYVDGRLETIGDSYVAEGRALALLGVKRVYSDGPGGDGDDCLRGGNGREGAAQTLGELEVFRAERVERQRAAALKRAQAEELRREADQLDPQGRS
jgi:hypothetical protein